MGGGGEGGSYLNSIPWGWGGGVAVDKYYRRGGRLLD